MCERLLTSPSYVARRQSLKLPTDFLLEPQNSLVMKRYILEIRNLKVIMTLLKKGRTSEKRLSQLQGLVQEERAFKATGNQWEVSKVSTPKIRCLRKLNLLRFADYS
ncbi:putative MO25-like protein [Drosera capensis]